MVVSDNMETMSRTMGNISLNINKKKMENGRRENIHKVLKLMSKTINYISHPSITSSLECNINFNRLVDLFLIIVFNLKGDPALQNVDFDKIDSNAIEGLIRSYIDIKFERKDSLLIFKDVEALKILHVLIVLINESDHPLYPCYLEWIKGENGWMSDSLSLFSLIKYKMDV
jgi:hypothetical protein